MENETQLAEIISTEIVYQQDKAAIDMQITTAKTYPRNITRSISNAIAIVTIDESTARTCTYAVPRGGKSITGPSVHLAKILAQVWGNLRIESKVVAIDDKHITSEAVCFDLENNLAIKTQVKRSIMQNEYAGGKRTGKMIRMNDDMITVTGNAGNSIALRNAILAVIPRSIVDKVYNTSIQVITGDVSDSVKFNARRKQVFDGLQDTFQLKEAEILKVVGKASISHITSEDIVTLIGIGQAIKDGDTSVEQAFRPSKSKEAPKSADKEKERLELLIKEASSIEELSVLELYCTTTEMKKLFTDKKEFLS